jgi:hypothetical protein
VPRRQGAVFGQRRFGRVQVSQYGRTCGEAAEHRAQGHGVVEGTGQGGGLGPPAAGGRRPAGQPLRTAEEDRQPDPYDGIGGDQFGVGALALAAGLGRETGFGEGEDERDALDGGMGDEGVFVDPPVADVGALRPGRGLSGAAHQCQREGLHPGASQPDVDVGGVTDVGLQVLQQGQPLGRLTGDDPHEALIDLELAAALRAGDPVQGGVVDRECLGEGGVAPQQVQRPDQSDRQLVLLTDGQGVGLGDRRLGLVPAAHLEEGVAEHQAGGVVRCFSGRASRRATIWG